MSNYDGESEEETEDGIVEVPTIKKEAAIPLWKRQEALGLKVPKIVGVIGLGGVGSWVGWGFGLSGTEKLIFVDHDNVSASNLNRTPFRIKDIGASKVLAMSEILLERREMEIVPIKERIENIPVELLDDAELIVDCRDTIDPLDAKLQARVRIIGGYDGNSMTMHLNPNPKSIWSTTRKDTGYTAVPSSLLPTWGIAWNIVTYILACKPRSKEFIRTFNVDTLTTQMLGLKNEKGVRGKC